MSNKNSLVAIWTDGSYSRRTNCGGWGVLFRMSHNGKLVDKECQGATFDTTNNRMEMMAAIKALDTLTRPCLVRITTDSTYLFHGITDYIYKWEANGYQRKGIDIPNADLWQQLRQLEESHIGVNWYMCKSRNTAENDIAHELANEARRGLEDQREAAGLPAMAGVLL